MLHIHSLLYISKKLNLRFKNHISLALFLFPRVVCSLFINILVHKLLPAHEFIIPFSFSWEHFIVHLLRDRSYHALNFSLHHPQNHHITVLEIYLVCTAFHSWCLLILKKAIILGSFFFFAIFAQSTFLKYFATQFSKYFYYFKSFYRNSIMVYTYKIFKP